MECGCAGKDVSEFGEFTFTILPSGVSANLRLEVKALEFEYLHDRTTDQDLQHMPKVELLYILFSRGWRPVETPPEPHTAASDKFVRSRLAVESVLLGGSLSCLNNL